jgi:hypothetical protein
MSKGRNAEENRALSRVDPIEHNERKDVAWTRDAFLWLAFIGRQASGLASVPVTTKRARAGRDATGQKN